VLEGLHPNKPAISNSSKVYFLWLKKIPFLDLENSNPRKNFSVDQDP